MGTTGLERIEQTLKNMVPEVELCQGVNILTNKIHNTFIHKDRLVFDRTSDFAASAQGQNNTDGLIPGWKQWPTKSETLAKLISTSEKSSSGSKSEKFGGVKASYGLLTAGLSLAHASETNKAESFGSVYRLVGVARTYREALLYNPADETRASGPETDDAKLAAAMVEKAAPQISELLAQIRALDLAIHNIEMRGKSSDSDAATAGGGDAGSDGTAAADTSQSHEDTLKALSDKKLRKARLVSQFYKRFGTHVVTAVKKGQMGFLVLELQQKSNAAAEASSLAMQAEAGYAGVGAVSGGYKKAEQSEIKTSQYDVNYKIVTNPHNVSIEESLKNALSVINTAVKDAASFNLNTVEISPIKDALKPPTMPTIPDSARQNAKDRRLSLVSKNQDIQALKTLVTSELKALESAPSPREYKVGTEAQTAMQTIIAKINDGNYIDKNGDRVSLTAEDVDLLKIAGKLLAQNAMELSGQAFDDLFEKAEQTAAQGELPPPQERAANRPRAFSEAVRRKTSLSMSDLVQENEDFKEKARRGTYA
ncbi:hypothetical protein [Eilatimonas milleporae]|uniref:Uncharacterized protein n=1 Tax=Eilatimonas milleporae TaxID=911205 RepID=A0A3M0CRN1_9PROT|nr:hypothetical protein [Eilatimonas milleporae]RMB12221.1 hypothetical protein BXY39_0714 [Eilatimonas milleporae]